ncbi:hypothetical protein V8F06_014343 [Rhypophila decipiens]
MPSVEMVILRAPRMCRRPSLRPRWQTPSSLTDHPDDPSVGFSTSRIPSTWPEQRGGQRPGTIQDVLRTMMALGLWPSHPYYPTPSAPQTKRKSPGSTAEPRNGPKNLSKRPTSRVIRTPSPNDLVQRTNSTFDLIDIEKAIIRRVEEITARSLNQVEELKKKEEERANRLEEIVRAQQDALKELQTALGETRAEFGQVKAELQVTRAETKEELRTVNSEVRAVRASVENQTLRERRSNPQCYSHQLGLVAFRPSNQISPSSSPHVRSNSVSPGSPASQKDQRPSYPAIELDLTGTDIPKNSPGEIRKTLNRSYGNHESTKSITYRGLTRSYKDENRVRVLFQSAEEVERVRDNQEWVGDISGVRLSVERGYPVKVDGVNKLALFETMESVNLREDAAKVIGKENGASVVRVGWLSKYSGRPYGPAVVYFKTKAEADSMLQKGTLDFGGETAFYLGIRVPRPKPGPMLSVPGNWSPGTRMHEPRKMCQVFRPRA